MCTPWRDSIHVYPATPLICDGQVERTHCISLRRQYPVVVHALERLQNQGDDKAGQFLASIMRFQFIIALVIAEHILHSTNSAM
jgi:hypothetical protein